MTTPPHRARGSLVRPDDATPVARAGEARFTDQDLALILRQAAELQEGVGQSGVARFTLAEIQQIASEAGIDPSHVATVAAGLRDRSALGAGFMGAPWRFRFDESVAGEVDDDVVGALIDGTRRAARDRGRAARRPSGCADPERRTAIHCDGRSRRVTHHWA